MVAILHPEEEVEELEPQPLLLRASLPSKALRLLRQEERKEKASLSVSELLP